MNLHPVDLDAFADGQMGSKLWLCDELERVIESQLPSRPSEYIWVLCGWYALATLLLRVRGRLPIAMVRSFDVDSATTEVANKMHNHWEMREWSFRAFTTDINRLAFSSGEYGPPPTLVLNTSCEHLENRNWFDRIPSGCLVAIQSTDMKHADHVARTESLDAFQHQYTRGFQTIFYTGEKEFRYPNSQFKRFMMIGTKI